MLYLTRKIGESVVINDEIEVTVVDIRGKSIKLGFTFPPEASVLRREIYDRIQSENQAAASASEAFAAVFPTEGDKKTLTVEKSDPDSQTRTDAATSVDASASLSTEPEAKPAVDNRESDADKPATS